MGSKRKPVGSQEDHGARHPKKVKQSSRKDDDKPALLCTSRPDWYAVELPALEQNDAKSGLPQPTIDRIHQYALSLLEGENAAYGASHMSSSSSHKFLSTIMTSGTLEDKISALTLLVQESPLHTMKALENLVGLARKKSRNQALMALAALKDLLGQGLLLPGDRKLRAFGKQSDLTTAFQGNLLSWTSSDPLPKGVQKLHLVVWAFEDWLKKIYFAVLQILEHWCNDQVEYARSRAITFVWELLKDKPEQEENLLRLLINKLGDTDRKIASRTSYLLLQLQIVHPAMKAIVINSIEADCLFRPGQSLNAKYYGMITLNQTILSQKEEGTANRLLSIYFSVFVQLLKLGEPRERHQTTGANSIPRGGGGGTPGKMAMKKRRAEERGQDSDNQLREKMTAQVLTGVNRAFPFADTSDAHFEKQLDMIFRVAHSANFNTSVQALMLLQQISSTKHFGAERFYRTLYESILDPRLFTSSKQVMYLNLLYKSLKADVNTKRVQAFVKRLLQVATMHEPPFACGVLYLVSELESTFPGIRNMLAEVEVADQDEEEHFIDVPENGEKEPTDLSATIKQSQYDGKKRDPEHAHAELTGLWDLLPTLQHFHPSVSLFADAIYGTKQMPPKPDPAQHTLMHFLDRFVYRNPRTKQLTTQSSSIMQPMAGSHAAGLLLLPDRRASRANPLNTETFWAQNIEDVAADEVFFHSYFNAAGSGKKRKVPNKQEKTTAEEGDSDDEGSQEEEIWQAIANSRPDVEQADSDDDLSLGDLESAYEDSASGSEAGIDLGGEGGTQVEDMDFGDDQDDSEFDIGDDAVLDDGDGITIAAKDSEEENETRGKKRGKSGRKLKNLPTFASLEDYAKLIDAEPDGI